MNVIYCDKNHDDMEDVKIDDQEELSKKNHCVNMWKLAMRKLRFS